jgi:prepilin-type N-terminal cleavage/methylation domain-containing protein
MEIPKSQKGFTLIELMVSVAVCVTALITIVWGNNYIQKVNHESFQRMVALQDAHQIIERIRVNANSGVFPASVTAAFPHNQLVAGFTNVVNNLPNEQVRVTYVDPTADPLDLSVVVSWQSGTRTVSATLSSFVTQRQ